MTCRVVLAVSLVALSSTVAFAEEAPRKRYLVGTRGPAVTFNIREAAIDRDVAIKAFRSVDGFGAELTEEEVKSLRRSPRVRFVEPDPVKYALDLSSGADAGSRTGQTVPYGIDLVKARQVWPVATGTAIRVGVIDTGIDAQHPDLAAHFRGGFDFVDNDSDPADLNGHGTHVAGTIAALDNNLGVVGVAPNVEIFALRVLGASGSGTTTDVILAVDWAIANQLHVLNLSLGSSDSALSEEQAFQKAADAGIVVFAASGNCFTGCEEFPEGVKERVDFPAAYSTVISVGAVDSGSRVASFSQRGGQLEFVAPGVGVLSTSRTGLSDIADVAFVDQSFFEADRFTLSPLGEVSGEYVFCGLGKPEEIPSGVNGKIALISRGETKFGDKVRNAMAAGARAAIIYNNKPANDPDGGTIRGTLCRDFDAANNCINQDDLIFPYILTISISKEDGEAMLNTNRGLATVSARPDDYAFLNGTSMATPHAAGVGALIWSVAPNATRAQIIDALLTTTVDLGAAGFDTTFGNGLVDAFAAARKLAPEKFVTSQPPPKNVRKRR